MFEITSPPRRLAIPLGHKLIAALIAIAVAVGLHAWFARNAGPSATVADLSFDTAAARRIDPGLADAPTPAVAIAQSFLTDQAVAALSKSAYLSTSAMNARVGEFRARLELTQPSAHLLRVQFHDPDPAKSAVTANAIANALAFPSSPISSSIRPPSSISNPVHPSSPSSSIATPARQSLPSSQDQSAPSLSASLGDIQAKLAATDRDIERLTSPEKRPQGWRRSWAHDPPSYMQARERQLLKAAATTALAQLGKLRAQYSSERRLAEIQYEIASILPGGSDSRHGRFNGAGINAAELRRERDQLTQAVSFIERDRQAIQREEAAASPSPSSARAAKAAAQPSAPSQKQPAPAAPQSAAAPPPSPFTLAQMAGATGGPSRKPFSWWPASSLPASWQPAYRRSASWCLAAAAGLLCGLLYLAFARRYRPVEYEESEIEPATYSSYRIITSDPPPVAPTTAPGDKPTPALGDKLTPALDDTPTLAPANKPSYDFVDPMPNKRASFTFDPPSPPRRTPFDPAPLQPSLPVAEQEGPVDIAEPNMISDNRPASRAENVVRIGDTWADQIAKTLAQTEIGRMLEGTGAEDKATEASQESSDSQKPSPRPNRRAG